MTDSQGIGLAGATLALSGTQTATKLTDANGNYSFSNCAAGGSFVITPSYTSYTLTYAFAPAGRSFSNLSANQTAADFTYTTTTQLALNSLADAYVQDGSSANTNFGSVTPILVKTANQAEQRRDAYLKFDLSPLSRTIVNAKLRFYAGLSAAGSVGISAYSVTDTLWSENAITWTNKPARGSTALSTVNVTSTTFASYDLDVTTYVVAEKTAGRNIVSLALHNQANSTPHILLNSREAATNKPQLVVMTSDNNNAAPSVSLTLPAGGASYTAPASIPLRASASDNGGSISRVDYYAGTYLIGTAITSPYDATWPNVGAGSYSITAVATDNQGLSAVSSAVQVTVSNGNVPPAVELTAPLNNANVAAGSNVTVSATASDVDGNVTQVEFFRGSTSLGIDTSAPYNVGWNNAGAGSYAITARATDNAGGITTSPQVNVNVVWQTGFTAVADTYVKDGSSATTNFGTALDLQVQQGASGSNRETQLRFDLTAVTGIAQAKLRVFGRLSDASGTNVGVSVYSVASTSWGETAVTWNTKPGAGSPALTTTTVTDNVGRWYEFDVSNYIKAERDTAGHTSVSLALKSQTAGNPFVTFNSREASTNRPQLVIWTTQARTALFAVGSSNLNAGDTAVKARLESLGFTVTVKVANNNLATVDVNGKALVVISSTCTATSVGAKFRHAAVPVVNWEFEVLDDFGMTGTLTNTDFGTSSTTQNLSITDAAHALAAGLPSGTTTVVTSASAFSWGIANVNAAKIATLVGDATKSVIFGYESGAQMPGLAAPARRVALFMTDLTANSFNSNGNALFEAAVRWATEVITAPTINQLTPSSGPVGTTVTISGINFGQTQGTSTVSFNGVAASPASWSEKTIVVAVPLYATTGLVVVKVNGVASNGVTFTAGEIDSDSDGLADSWELQYFGNLAQTAGGDLDGDGISNLQEYQQGRNPTLHAVFDEAAINLKVFTPLAPNP